MFEQAVEIDEIAVTPVFIVHENCGFAWDKRHAATGGREMEYCPECGPNLRSVK